MSALGEPLLTVVAPNLDYHNNSATRGKTFTNCVYYQWGHSSHRAKKLEGPRSHLDVQRQERVTGGAGGAARGREVLRAKIMCSGTIQPTRGDQHTVHRVWKWFTAWAAVWAQADGSALWSRVFFPPFIECLTKAWLDNRGNKKETKKRNAAI